MSEAMTPQSARLAGRGIDGFPTVRLCIRFLSVVGLYWLEAWYDVTSNANLCWKRLEVSAGHSHGQWGELR